MQQQQHKWLPLWVIKFWVEILFSQMLLLWKGSGDTGTPLKKLLLLYKWKRNKRTMASEICFPLEMHLVLNFKTLLRFFWCPGLLRSTPGSPSSESPQDRAHGMVQVEGPVPVPWHNIPMWSKAKNEIVLLCAASWAESGEAGWSRSTTCENLFHTQPKFWWILEWEFLG